MWSSETNNNNNINKMRQNGKKIERFFSLLLLSDLFLLFLVTALNMSISEHWTLSNVGCFKWNYFILNLHLRYFCILFGRGLRHKRWFRLPGNSVESWFEQWERNRIKFQFFFLKYHTNTYFFFIFDDRHFPSLTLPSNAMNSIFDFNELPSIANRNMFFVKRRDLFSWYSYHFADKTWTVDMVIGQSNHTQPRESSRQQCHAKH